MFFRAWIWVSACLGLFIFSTFLLLIYWIKIRKFLNIKLNACFCLRFCWVFLDILLWKYFWQACDIFIWCCYNLSAILFRYWAHFIGKCFRREHMVCSTSCRYLVFDFEVFFCHILHIQLLFQKQIPRRMMYNLFF